MIQTQGKVIRRKRSPIIMVQVTMDLRESRKGQERSGIPQKKIHLRIRMLVNKIRGYVGRVKKKRRGQRNQGGEENILVMMMMIVPK